jgi:hypothetical protein
MIARGRNYPFPFKRPDFKSIVWHLWIRYSRLNQLMIEVIATRIHLPYC